MTPGGPSTPFGGGMNYGMASANRVTWSASRGAYSQRRLMLWAADTAGATVEGRRFIAARRIRRRTSRDASDPTRGAAFLTPAPVGGSLTFRLRKSDRQRIRHAVASCFAPGNRARHSPRRSSRKMRHFGRTSNARSCVRRSVECRLSNHGPAESRSRRRHIARLDRENTETLHA